MFKRIFLFLVVNVLIVTTISILLNLLNVKPYLTRYGLDIKFLAIFCLIWGMAGSLISLMLSKKIAKWMLKISIIDPKESDENLKHIINSLNKLSKEAGLKKTPEIGIYKSNQVNAFATGASKNNSLIALSSKLLDNLNEDEIKGVLSHEISHIANGDMVTMCLLQGIVNAFVMFLARVFAFVLSSRNNNKRSSNLSFYMFTFLFEIVFMILGSIVICFFSRKREYRADNLGAMIGGKNNMIKALEALSKFHPLKNDKKEPKALQTLKISNNSLFGLFATHPPLTKRIEKLKEL